MDRIWHYPRIALAEYYLNGFLKTGLRRITLFAPRRMGKTEFLLEDLMPAAPSKGFFPLYISMWENLNAPHEEIKRIFEEALIRIGSKKSSIRRLLETPITKFKFDSELMGFGKLGTEIELASSPRQAKSDQLSLISSLCDQICKKLGKTRLLLLLDEIQHLATDKKFQALTHNLRTLLDRHPDIAVIFTGSSRNGLNRLFRESGAPLYDFADDMIFPPLEDDFVHFMGKIYQKITQRKLDLNAALQIFNEYQRSPGHMHMLIKLMINQAMTNIHEAHKIIQARIRDENQYEAQWQAMTPLDRYVYIVIYQHKPLFSDAHLVAIAKRKDLNSPSRSAVQAAIQRLERGNKIVRIGHGQYDIENTAFAKWALESEKTVRAGV